MKDIFDYIISGVSIGLLILAVYMVKKIPDMVRDKLKSDREFEFNKALQVDEFYRKDGNLQGIMLEWTNYAISNNAMDDLNKAKGLKKLQDLVQKTVGYGSSRTVKLLTEMFQEVYQNNDSKGQKDSSEDNKSDDASESDYTTMVVLAMVVSSLKEDFTGIKIEPLDVLKIRITDYTKYEETFKKIIDKTNEKLGVEI
ncbi:hypothetical protein [Lactococcus lactis]|uniref:hypothetical protein n=1 Tax=Lactococcus lactis TaxID=1358 RepID=UPI00050D09CC|nr:hypothetical protein [Lactococcus lactis]AIS03574.1 hypothetical protein LG36_0974 [Lactococcus lactis]MDT2905626.1 hypothetical protein [Lactococcus lactis]MDT2909130.1 hypothetical protein [Lactococcus lactis]MDT2925055.1 hypothetical protein [Lactococcus lactis]MDT2951878.1 hypothetical protein [Lactococcus lactis]